MQAAIPFKAALAVGVLVLAAGFLVPSATGQQMAERFNVGSGLGTTVSVATLRIPEKAWRHFAKAKAAAGENRPEEFDRETKKALAIAPDFASAYLLRAGWELQTHAYEAAVSDVKEARRVEPDAMWAGVLLAGAFNGMRRYEDARQVLAGLRGTEDQSWQAAYERARAATGLDDIEGALHWSSVAVAIAPENFPDVQLVRANVFLRARRWSEAQALLEQYLKSTASPERRAEVMAALVKVKRVAAEEEMQKVASR